MKMPFVVTVSLAASACGGTVLSRNDGDGNGGSGAVGGAPIGGGGAASVGGKTANGGVPSSGGYVNEGGAGSDVGWGGSINPPYPPVAPSCPVNVPMGGAPCSSTGQGCRYPQGICFPDLMASCASGTWSVLSVPPTTSCNPPAPSCPDISPADGSYCAYGETCYYADSSCPGVFTQAACLANVWHVTPSPCGVQDAGPPALDASTPRDAAVVIPDGG
ncbi:MAG TPA: hypothetical protein VH062_23090 [Polyangiaceae bacterium]|nr:hypothetical protein [Polyangiaceae bacterium]